MNPARHTSSTPRDFSSRASVASYSSREANPLWLITSVSIPAVRARASPCASARFEMTIAIRACSTPLAIASMIDWRLLPRPEISTPSVRCGN
jgi:hypothetical protein